MALEHERAQPDGRAREGDELARLQLPRTRAVSTVVFTAVATAVANAAAAMAVASAATAAAPHRSRTRKAWQGIVAADGGSHLLVEAIRADETRPRSKAYKRDSITLGAPAMRQRQC